MKTKEENIRELKYWVRADKDANGNYLTGRQKRTKRRKQIRTINTITP